MVKQIINIVGIASLYNIFEEIKDYLSFDVVNYSKVEKFFEDLNQNETEYLNSLIITKVSNREHFKKKQINNNSIFYIYNKDSILDYDSRYNLIKYPFEINSLVEKIKNQLIKQKYNYQSKIKVNNYYLDLNSKIISNDKNLLKLTEREMDIILFLYNNKKPQKISILQSQVWKYSTDLETHTVETHIYRLRKKINDNFKDDNFIISTDQGYLIK